VADRPACRAPIRRRVKPAVEEPETQALRIELNRWDTVATSVITEIEPRARLPGLASAVRRRLTASQVWTITTALLELELTPDIRPQPRPSNQRPCARLTPSTSQPRHLWEPISPAC